MFKSRQKIVDRQETVIHNQNNLIENLNKNVMRHQEEAERLRASNRELSDIIVKKDLVIDRIEASSKKRLEIMAYMLKCMGFDQDKIIELVMDDESSFWTVRAFNALAGYPGNKVKDFVNEPLSSLLEKLDESVVAEIPGSNDDKNKKIALQQLYFLVMTINRLAAKDSWKE